MNINTVILIPARNEGDNCIPTLLESCKQAHVILVTNGCSPRDTTAQVGATCGVEVYEAKAKGKAPALLEAVETLNLTERFEFIALVDADTVIYPNFIEQAISEFKEDTAAITGTAVSHMPRWSWNPLLAGRAVGYFRSQVITRNLQQFVLRAPTVMCGSNAVFRSDVFLKVFQEEQFSVTEDFQTLIDIDRLGLGRTVHSHKARATTQDPEGLRDYVKQVSRWSLGNMQTYYAKKVGTKPRRIDVAHWLIWIDQLLWVLSPLLTFLLAMWVGVSEVLVIGSLVGSFVGILAASIYWRRPTIIILFPFLLLGDILNRGLLLWGIYLFIKQPKAESSAWISPRRA